MKHAVILLSGGLDSAVLLARERGRRALTALSFDLAGRPRGEARACAALARWAGIPLFRVAVPFLKPRPSGYVPARNLVYHSIALSVAEELGAVEVLAGHNRSDAAIFADAQPAFFRRLERLNGGARIVLPFARLSDAQVLASGLRIGAPIALSWSCYRDGPRPCRRCAACRGRLQSFRRIGIEDPA